MSDTTETSILDRLRTAMSPVKVYDTEIPPNEGFDPLGDTPFSPFLEVIWGGPITVLTDKGIVSSRLDLMLGYVIVRVVTPDADTNRRLHSKMFNALVGWYPDDSGEMSPEAGMQYTNGSTTTKPTRYYREQAFSYRTNTAGMGLLG